MANPPQWSSRLPTIDEIQLHGVKHKRPEEDAVSSVRTLWMVFFESSPFPCVLVCYLRDEVVRWGYSPTMAGQVPEAMLDCVVRTQPLTTNGEPAQWPELGAILALELYIKEGATSAEMLWLLRKLRDEGYTQYALQERVESMRVTHKNDELFEERALTALDMITGFVGNPAYRVFE